MKKKSLKAHLNFILDKDCLSSLLPYDLEKKNKSQLRTSLNEYLLLLVGSLKAIEAIESENLEQFDALVGENACQLRAVLISIIASKNKSFYNLKDKINKTKEKLCWLLEKEKISKLMYSGVSLNEVILNEDLTVLLNFEELFLIQCFFLTKVKVLNYQNNVLENLFIKEKCIPSKLKEWGDVSSSFTDNLISKLRKSTAKNSIRFIRGYAKKSQDKNLIRMISDEFSVNHNNNLLCVPMFWAYKTLIYAAKLEKIKIILNTKLLINKITRFEVFDEYWFDSEVVFDEKNKKFVLTVKEIDWNNLDKGPCIVFQGVSCLNNNDSFYREKWKFNILKFSLDNIILCGAADHRQYPNEEDDLRFFQFVQDHEYETYKSLAREEGFSFENPSTFFIQHVYATNTKTLSSKNLSLSLNESYQPNA